MDSMAEEISAILDLGWGDFFFFGLTMESKKFSKNDKWPLYIGFNFIDGTPQERIVNFQ